MSHFPGAALFDTDQPAQKYRRDAFAGVDHVIDRQQPFPKRQLRAVHGGSGGDRKLAFTLGTLVKPGPAADATERVSTRALAMGT